jgi:hypothetical protein
MKNKILILPLIAMVILTVASCGNGENKVQDSMAADSTVKSAKEITDLAGVTSYYECPMKCEGKKFSEPGNCPICGMELVLVEVKSDSTQTSADTTKQM